MNIKRTLHISQWEGFAYSLMVGLGETMVPALAFAVSANHKLTGMIAILPHFVGAILQLFSSWGLKLFGTRKRFVAFCAGVQSLSLLLIALTAPTYDRNLELLFVLCSLYWAMGLSAGPNWNAWVGSIVPANHRIRFFSIRSQILQFGTATGMVLASVALDLIEQMLAFQILFFSAFLCRFISAALFYFHEEDHLQRAVAVKPIDLRVALEWLMQPQIRRLLISLFFLYLTAHIAAPYFNPYMLGILKLSSSQYMICLLTAFLARFLAYSFLQKVAMGKGAIMLVIIGSIGVTPLPWMWTWSQNLGYVLFVQVLGGFFWASFELGLLLTILDRHESDERSRILTTVNVVQAIGMLGGSLVGVVMIDYYGEQFSTYQKLFAISSLGRIVPMLVLPTLMVPGIKVRPIFMRVISGRVWGSLSAKPVLYTEESPPQKKPPA